MATASNPHEEKAREAKAQRLARRAVEALIATAEPTGPPTLAGESFWTELLKAEEIGTASVETRQRVVAILRMLRPVKLEGWNL